MQHSYKRGFSLVELSIVLVILGLLVGGILGGQSLIRAAELRKVIVEYEQWQTAVNSFRQKYNALAGDFDKATRFWGEGGGCDSEIFDLNLSSGTCNGDGNGVLTQSNSTPVKEAFLFWNHLSLSGVITGSYGTELATATALEQAYPLSGFSGAYWMVSPAVTDSFNANLVWPPMRNHQYYVLAGMRGDMVFSPEEAWQIDSKLDDGKPATGTIFTGPGTGTGLPDCTEKAGGAAGLTTTDDLDAEYKLSVSAKACNLFFKL